MKKNISKKQPNINIPLIIQMIFEIKDVIFVILKLLIFTKHVIIVILL